jgi:hypothetical protein
VEPEVPEGGVPPEEGEHPPQVEVPHYKQYDYTVKVIDQEFEAELNAMGAKGWRFVQREGDNHILWERVRR